jgi:hypothetical protein
MMPYQTYQVYEAGRSRTVAERRDADLRLGQIAVAASRLWCDATRPVRALRGLLHQSRDSWVGERTHYTAGGDAAIRCREPQQELAHCGAATYHGERGKLPAGTLEACLSRETLSATG